MLHAFAAQPAGLQEDDAPTLAAMLLNASPNRAPAFALMMHERMCAGHDETACALWADIVAVLHGRTPAFRLNLPGPLRVF